MLAVLLLEKGQKLCSIPQIMPKIMLAQSARAYCGGIFIASKRKPQKTNLEECVAA